ncbi:DUF4190 domain-containing protein [Streptomyces sp. A3M-1-3]|uniref:DUF4190 domain-containing protein n=1 Tax=Streptomyces sp. A3M-1-3 TaxID=2962044 RepID=UPI0020B7212C|nr:DUF4190 domain-containing protein [Streptomyces sp. A3M-1-3]MCP3820738.1 DUF4190 domain-containing protein [Streptomyces sp. A3M-1-3]
MDTPPPPPSGQVPQGWPPPPQHPYGYGYPYQQQQPPLNGLAVASLVLGLLCCLPIGLVLGIVALSQIKRKGERGQGLATAGIVLSSVSTLFLVIGLAVGGASGFRDAFEDGLEAGSRTRSTMDLTTGDCFNVPGGDLEAEVYDVTVVPCTEQHDAEVYGTHTLDGTLPGPEALAAEADEQCWRLQDKYAMDPWAVPDHVDTYSYSPTSESWKLGDRLITCAFGSEDGPLRSSLKQEATSIDAHQLAYLQAAHPTDFVAADAPEAEIEEDLESYQVWAEEMSDTLTGQARQLRAHAWPASADKAVKDRIREIEGAQKHWAKAAGAADEETFWKHWEAADLALDIEVQAKDAKAREALGLDTTPPVYDDEDSSAGDSEGANSTGGSGSGSA